MHILVVSQHFYPEQFRINDLCTSLVKRGHQVTVLTGLPNYPQGKIYSGYQNKKLWDEWVNGVHIIRCHLIGRGKTAVQFGLNYLWFVFSAKHKVKQLIGDFDLVFSYQTSPVSMAIPAITAKQKFHIPLLLYCLDQWPISVTAGPISKNSLFYRYLYRLSVNTYQQADRILITSKSFADYFENELHLSKEQYGLTYWPQYAEKLFEDVGQVDNEQFDLVYAGNIGVASQVDWIIEAARRLQDHPHIHFHIVGDGSERKRCEQLANGLSNITFYGSFPVTKMRSFYELADAFLITMQENEVINMTLPAKMQSYMLAKKMVLGCIGGETKNVIESCACGLCAAPKDIDGFVANILLAAKDKALQKTCGQNGYAYYQQHFDQEKLLAQLEVIMDDMVKEHKQ